MNIKRKNASNSYILAYLLRRAVYALVVIMMDEYPAMQIIVLLVTSVIVTACLVKGKPYQTPLSHWTVIGFEFIFAWTCVLCMMFSPEYMYRSYEIATDMANAICIITTCVAGVGVLLLTYSLCWQAGFNKRRHNNMLSAAELARLQRLQKHQKLDDLEPIQEEKESGREDYIPDGRTKRQKQKQRKLRDV